AEPEHRGWHADLRAASPNLEAILTTGANDDGGGAGDYEALIAVQEPLSGEAIDGIARDTDPCSILYTAGTTGFPKGAVRTHKAVLWYILNAGAMSSPGDRGEAYLAVPPMFHIAGHETRLPMTVMRGSRMVILTAFNPGQVLDFIEQERVTAMFVPPTMGHVMLQTMAEGRWDLSSWREWISASAPLPAPVRDRALELLPHLQFSNSLGMTEAGVLASAGGDILARKVSTCVGRAAPTVALAILDPSGQPQPTGESGEICIRSPQVIEAYWHNPEATANATEGGWFHTGDVGVLDHERHLTVLDRIKDMIITGGENVYAPEVESQLLAFPEIADAAVFGLPDEKWGEIVVAALVQKPQAELTGREVIERCRERIAHYKCPSRVLFVDALPRNAMGKVMKQQLRDGYQGATP
ncbi:MAG: AMP-binding protein, partial [Pseudomonadota bacterium]|nr:AMP-binding protein [Pseudomonadota bacterium]